MGMPLVSIITVNFDHPEVTCGLLGSLRQITYRNIEIIVIDNASPTSDPSVIKRDFPEVTFIQSDRNRGFAGGNNLGIRKAKGKYILLLNNDTEVPPGFLEPLVNKLEADKMIGAVSPKIKFSHSPDTIQYAGIPEFNTLTVSIRAVGKGDKDIGQFDRDSQTAFVHGAAMVVPLEVIRKVGLMAEVFFLYYEEHDWATRIKQAGYQLWYVHDSVVFHKESISTGKQSPLKTYYLNRSRVLYLRRNVKGIKFFIALSYLVLVSIPKNLLGNAFTGNKGHLKAYISAIAWHIGHLSDKAIHSQPEL